MTIIVDLDDVIEYVGSPNSPQVQVFRKDLNSATFLLQLEPSVFLLNETVSTVALISVNPISQNPLVVSNLVPQTNGTSFTFDASGGDAGVTYGASILVSTSQQRNFRLTAALLVEEMLTTSYASKSPTAYQSLIGKIEAGDASVGRAFFIAAPGVDTTSGYVTWELVDSTGAIYSSGNAFDFLATQSAFHTTIEAQAVISVPSTVPPTAPDQRYQIRWFLHSVPPGSEPSVQAESLEVISNLVTPVGAQSSMEMAGDVASLVLVTERPYTTVSVAVYNGNTLVGTTPELKASTPVSSGWQYEALFDTSAVAASLDPYTVVWKCQNSGRPSPDRFTSQLFVASPSIMDAVTDVQAQVMKARTVLREEKDAMFDHLTVAVWLRRGRDYFNGAAGILTFFTMTNATGSIREYWLRYSEAAALQAQYLAEGEKSFNFSGTDIQLDVDHAQYYDSMADKILQSVNENVATFKKNLQIKGVNGGDGNIAAGLVGGARALGAVGVSYSPISPRPPVFGGNWTNR